MKPSQAVALLMAAIVGVIFSDLCDGAGAGPLAAMGAPVVDPATAPAAAPRGRTYLFRGFAGLVFSRGTNELGEKIERAGMPASVHEFAMCLFVAKQAIREYRDNPAPIVVIGHSTGGYCALKFAEMLQDEHIPVSLLVTTDPARISPDVPLNVERYINIFQSNSLLGGHDVMPAAGFQGHYASYDLAEHKEISHLNIEKLATIHEQLLRKIVQLAVTPARAQGEAVPLHYVVPTDAAIELWDSGMPVFARAGDTLQTLAAAYQVPLWSLTQINRIAKGVPLAPSQRIVVPRRLVPVAASDAGADSVPLPANR
jgi:LysM domain